jgi:hypothetical protein
VIQSADIKIRTYLRNGHQSTPNVAKSSMESDSEKGLLNGTKTKTKNKLQLSSKNNETVIFLQLKNNVMSYLAAHMSRLWCFIYYIII